MAYRKKPARIYPYNTGLLLGSELDVVITNENSEPIDASYFVKDTVIDTHGNVNENQHSLGTNRLKPYRGMVRLFTRHSYCRAYSTDNVWWLLKHLIGILKKQACLSSRPMFEDGNKIYTAGGHTTYKVKSQGIYNSSTTDELKSMTYDANHKSHQRLKDNIRLIVGLLSLLLDRRESAEQRREEYGPFSHKEFRVTETMLTYQTPSNFWLFSPALAHLMFGAGRWAFFLTQNNFENELCEGFEPGDIKNAIHHSDYKTGMEIWNLIEDRLPQSGYRIATNPFNQKTSAILRCLFDYGVGIIGDGVYKNWHMKKRKNNFTGHFHELPSWESGVVNQIFTDKHPMYQRIQTYMEKKNVGQTKQTS